jgi:Cu-Zn family superoxide dismutase
MLYHRLSKFFILLALMSFTALGAITLLAQEEVGETATAILQDAAGNEFGQITFTQIEGGKVLVEAEVINLEPGFHGFHVHATGACDPSGERAFSSAGGHFVIGEETAHHGAHNGDLPSLLVTSDGTGMAMFVTDRFTLADLFNEDGSAVIIHAGADNFGNIPADRYDPDADETTLNTGDAGGRAGCGVIESSQTSD